MRSSNVLALVGLFTLVFANFTEACRGDDADASPPAEPGLIARWKSLKQPPSRWSSVEAKPALTIDEGGVHPRIPLGPFETEWTGEIMIRDAGPIRFSAFLVGSASVSIDNVKVLDAQSETDEKAVEGNEPLTREPGYYPLRIVFRSNDKGRGRFQLWHAGPGFAKEPLPAWFFRHAPKTATPADRDDLAGEAGRRHVLRLGCKGCHSSSIPGVDGPPPGPSLEKIGEAMSRDWLLGWLADPTKHRVDARMPAGLFANNREGFVERWLIAETLSARRSATKNNDAGGKPADHRMGRRHFVSVGCIACHFIPDIPRAEQKDLDRRSLSTIADRLTPADVVAHILDPQRRYPDGRMPKIPMSETEARDVSAYLFLWSQPSAKSAAEPPTGAELKATLERLGAGDQTEAGRTLLSTRGCTGCHAGLGDSKPKDVPVAAADGGCLNGKAGPRFSLDGGTRQELLAFLRGSSQETHPPGLLADRRKIDRAGCLRCHGRDAEGPSPMETAASTLGGAYLQELPFQRIPRLTFPHQKLSAEHLHQAVEKGVKDLRPSRYIYRMPEFGAHAPALVEALARLDGERPSGPKTAPIKAPADPTLATLHGPSLVGFQGYACVSCHVWNGKLLGSPDPGAIGPDLTRTVGRIRREWFDRYLEAPLRHVPGTPMPAVFPRGKPALLSEVLEGSADRQRDAIWAYLASGKNAPGPKPAPPMPIAGPAKGEPCVVAQIPIRVSPKSVIESISILGENDDLLVYDLATNGLHGLWRGARILRNVQGRTRQFLVDGELTSLVDDFPIRLSLPNRRLAPKSRRLLGYERLADGVRIRWHLEFDGASIEFDDTIRLPRGDDPRQLQRNVAFRETPANARIEVRFVGPEDDLADALTTVGKLFYSSTDDRTYIFRFGPDATGRIEAAIQIPLPEAKPAPKWTLPPVNTAQPAEGSLIRPGYRAITFPRPKTATGEDRVMPGAVAVNPKTGVAYVASLKTGELFVATPPKKPGEKPTLKNYAHGLFQDALSMFAEGDDLYVLHRRNLAKVSDKNGDGVADRFDRVLALPHGVADTYDYAYGLTKDHTGNFVIGYAPYANQKMPGSGGAIRLRPGSEPEEISFGMRNPVGWAANSKGEVFFTDNQGESVATNKLSYVDPGKYHGFPNPAQRHHADKPHAKTSLWIPYGWARSINGATYDNTGGKFGPFAEQFFLAELMYGGAILRASMEKVNGVYQGACFPFWGKGLLGPLTLAFDPAGPLWVGGITEPGWMAQPDRGALFRLEFTGETPFEMKTLRVRPKGFQVVFTKPVDLASASALASYSVESFRYETTGSYGSPELDRKNSKIERVDVAADRLSANLVVSGLTAGRVYLVTLSGVRSAAREPLVHPTGAYTLQEIPKE